MARIKLGPMVTDISGSIGGMTIQRNRFGMTMRLKPLPLYSETPAQYTIRQKILSLQYSWQDLSDAERLQWDRFMDFSGQTIRRDRSVLLSGQSLFIKYQLFRLLYDQSLLTTITYASMPDVGALLSLKRDGSDFYFTFSAMDKTIFYFIIKLSIPRIPSQAWSPKGLRFMKCLFDDSGTKYIQDQYIAAFGALPSVSDVLHYTLQYFSITAPVWSSIKKGFLTVTAP